LKYETLGNNNYWDIGTLSYRDEYKQYFEKDKVVMGLGTDLDLKEISKSGKEVELKFKKELENFLSIKKGDFVKWDIVGRINSDETSYLEFNSVLGKVKQDFDEGYEFIKNIGHSLAIDVIDKAMYKGFFVDGIQLYEIQDINKELSDFKKMKEVYDWRNTEVKKWYIKFWFFGLENIEYIDKDLKISLKYFDSKESKQELLETLKQVQEGDYVFGEFISGKYDKQEGTRVIGKIKYIVLEETIEFLIEVLSEENIENYYSARIFFDLKEKSIQNINFINNKLRKNKNTILYGPPGTGKTYSIYNEIISITDPYMIISGETTRENINKEIKKLQEDNKIKFCTFHQSYGYEEFIEGLRSDGEGNFVVEDGSLKEIAIEALFDALLYECKAEIVDNEAAFDKNDLKIKKKEAVLKYINQASRFDFFYCDQYIVIIDEINRGNISKIFGELITLLEEDKRLSKENEMIIKLPYSKEDFVLPPNLHLIGTMNTSDKSIAPIDIALRRRFKFVEVMPNEELLKNVDGIELSKMLKRINDRIEYLYDRDHMIGHAYFINSSSLEDIINIFRDKIIPLLQEYFYEDWNKIALVLGGVGSSKDDKYMIYKKDINPERLFNNFSDEDFKAIPKYYIKDEIGYQEIKSIYE
jgi:5-methylcytosine-specific restriction protein B